MLSMLPKIALFLCFLIFLMIIIKVLFFTKKEDVKHMSELPLDDDISDINGND